MTRAALKQRLLPQLFIVYTRYLLGGAFVFTTLKQDLRTMPLAPRFAEEKRGGSRRVGVRLREPPRFSSANLGAKPLLQA